MAAKKKARRTTHRSSKGKKLYAKRNRRGQFKDIQAHKRASAADQRKRAKAEGKKRKKKVARKAAKKTRSAKKAAPRKVTRPVAAKPQARPAPAPKPAPKPTPIVPLAPIDVPVSTAAVEQGNLGFEASNDAMAEKPTN